MEEAPFRFCYLTGEKITEGYVIGFYDHDQITIKNDESLLNNYILNRTTYQRVNDAFEEGYFYYTAFD